MGVVVVVVIVVVFVCSNDVMLGDTRKHWMIHNKETVKVGRGLYLTRTSAALTDTAFLEDFETKKNHPIWFTHCETAVYIHTFPPRQS